MNEYIYILGNECNESVQVHVKKETQWTKLLDEASVLMLLVGSCCHDLDLN